jgi:hypothetical protein
MDQAALRPSNDVVLMEVPNLTHPYGTKGAGAPADGRALETGGARRTTRTCL